MRAWVFTLVAVMLRGAPVAKAEAIIFLPSANITVGQGYEISIIKPQGIIFGNLYLASATGSEPVTRTSEPITYPMTLATISSTYNLYRSSLDPANEYTFQLKYYSSSIITSDKDWKTTGQTGVYAVTAVVMISEIPGTATASTPMVGNLPDSPRTEPVSSIIHPTPSLTPASGPGETGAAFVATTSVAIASVPPAGGVSGAISNDALSTGAKVGIAVGAVAFVLLIVLIVLLIWRFNRSQKTRPQRLAYGDGAGAGMLPYTHDRGTDRDLTVEKEMNIVSTPTYGGHIHHTDTGFSDLAPAGVTAGEIGQARGSGSWTDSPPAPGAGAGTGMGMGGPTGLLPQHYPNSNPEPYRDSPYMSPVQAQAPSHSPLQQVSALTPTRELGSELAPLQEPGMSAEELARLEEEERRLDEAIAEAERRQRGGS